MKNMFRSTAAWLNDKMSGRFSPAPVLVALEPPQATHTATPVAEMTSDVHKIDPNLPKLKIQLKGAMFYACCPHCESQFNLEQRLSDPRFRRLFPTKGMTCPKCEKQVAMPTREDLEKRAH